MKFMNINYLPLIILIAIVFTLYVIRYELSFFKWIKKYFFLERTWSNKLSSLFLVTAITLLLTSLLDIRGPETKHEADIPDQKTIIIIDSSASMLAEDVRPNRFKKALILARHFIKKAAGHQIAVVLFSDTQKRLVPFTDDIDLLDARVDGLSKIEIQNGGSNIKQAIAESLQYFKAQDSKVESVNGNILVFTDSESNSESFNFEIPDTVNIAMIGVGTVRGAPIPLRNKNGVFRGYKSFKGEKVISKLDESFLKSFSKIAKNYKYWVSTSFTIPTEDILDFFRQQHKKTLSKGLVRSRPVYAKYILIPALIFYLMANILTLRPVFFACLLLFATLSPALQSYAQDDQDSEEKPEKEIDGTTLKLMNEMKKGKLETINKFRIAQGLLVAERVPESEMMYNETFKEVVNKDKIDPKIRANYGTLFLKKNEINMGATIYEKILNDPEVSEKIKEITRKNILLALTKKQGKDSKKKKKSKNKGKGEDKDKSKDSQKGDGESEGSNSGQSKDKKNKNDKKDKKQKEDNKKENEKKDKKSNSKKDDKKKKKTEKKQTLEEREDEIRKKRKLVKIPAMLKQIMSDDSQLQKTYLDTSTKKKNSRNKKKDW